MWKWTAILISVSLSKRLLQFVEDGCHPMYLVFADRSYQLAILTIMDYYTNIANRIFVPVENSKKCFLHCICVASLYSSETKRSSFFVSTISWSRLSMLFLKIVSVSSASSSTSVSMIASAFKWSSTI